jgi:5-methylcytosine-specific restriction endonuclease McrA
MIGVGICLSTDWANQFYKSTMWQKTRSAYISYKRGLCERCLEHGIVRAGVEVHHVQPLTQKNINDPNITLNWNNLMLLCPECHDEIHRRTRDKSKHKRFVVKSDGTIATMSAKTTNLGSGVKNQ